MGPAGPLRVAGALAASVMILAVCERLNASGWPVGLRAALVVLPALFWSATVVAALEGLRPEAGRLEPVWLGAIGIAALVVAERLAAFGGWTLG